MSYFAAAVVRGATGWAAAELDLSDAADVEDVAERLRDVSPDAAVSLLFVESDDAYLVVLRLDEGEDLRIFGSDGTFATESRLGALLLGEIEDPALDFEEESVVDDPDAATDEEETSSVAPEIEPIGDPDLLSDLGVSPRRLLELCGREGMLPADITAEVCQGIGCGDEVEELREA